MYAAENDLASRYRSLSVRELQQVAFYEVADLTPEAFQVLRQECRTRLPQLDCEGAFAIQLHGLPQTQLDNLIERVSTLPCPHCSAHRQPLDGLRVVSSTGLLFTSRTKNRVLIGCPRCLRRRVLKSSLWTLVAGWWAIPFGPKHTLSALVSNLRSIRMAAHSPCSSDFKTFVETHAAEIKAKMNHSAALRQFLTHPG